MSEPIISYTHNFLYYSSDEARIIHTTVDSFDSVQTDSATVGRIYLPSVQKQPFKIVQGSDTVQ